MIDIDGIELTPVGDRIILKLLEDEQEPNQNGLGSKQHDNELLFALVLAAGPDAEVKKGKTVIVHGWVRDEERLDDNVVMTSSWSVVAAVNTT